MKYKAIANELADLLIQVLEDVGLFAESPEAWTVRCAEVYDKLCLENEAFDSETEAMVDVLSSIEFTTNYKDGNKDWAKVDRSKIEGLVEIFTGDQETKH